MSDDTARVPDPEWPTHCEHCGTALASAEVGVMPGGDEQLDTVVARDFCPNADCPGKQLGAPTSRVEERPGSLGGDNGGG